MSPSTEIGLFAPPLMAAIVFVLTWNIDRTTSPTGTMTRARRKLYLLGCGLLMLMGYVMLWQSEIKATWLAYPFWMSIGFTGIAGCLIYLVVAQRGARPQDLEINENSPSYVAKPVRSAVSRIFAWVVIAWGIAGLIGGVVAVVRKAMFP